MATNETNGLSKKHSWKFFRAGGFDQVKLETGNDIAALEQLDQKLWVALACPTRGIEFDPKTLDMIDTDKDGRIRAPEILAATKWVCSVLKTPDTLLKASPSLELSAINDATPEGKQLLTSARQILTNLGKSGATSISVEDTTDTAKIFSQTFFNGDGIVPAEATDDPAVKAVMTDIMSCMGAEGDRGGKPGVNQAKTELFFKEVQAFSDWWKKAESDATLLPAGAGTAAAFQAMKAIKPKVDDYFARCRVVAFDARAMAALNREEKEYLALAAKDLTISSAEIAALPLTQVAAGKALSLKTGLNPAWTDKVAALDKDAIKPLLGERQELSEADWAMIQSKLGSYESWLAGKAGAAVEKLGLPRVREILAGKAQEQISALLARDKATEAEFNAISAVEKLVRFNRDLHKLLVNYVNFSDFYGRKDKAIFQAGTLFLDQRSCALCLTVEDAGRHAAMAGLAGSYLAYCDCTRKGTNEKLSIVAAFTDGDSDNLMAGRNGVFYDRKGRDWDATITKILDNPISIRQAFWAPYKKLVRMIEQQVAKRAAAAEADSTSKLEAVAVSTANLDKTAKTAKPAESKKIDVGTVAALGVAFGAIGGAISGFAAGLMKIEPKWQIPLVFVGLVLLISLPSMLIAWLKLRKRNLGPILDANGWAVNAKARINVPFGASLTEVAKLPPGSQRDLVDPFAEKKSSWPSVIVLVILLWITYSLLNNKGYVHKWTDGWIGTRNVELQPLPSATSSPAKPALPTPASAPTPAVEK